jgi:hypothetical protein
MLLAVLELAPTQRYSAKFAANEGTVASAARRPTAVQRGAALLHAREIACRAGKAATCCGTRQDKTMFLLKISMKKTKQKKKLQKGWMQLMMLRRPDDVDAAAAGGAMVAAAPMPSSWPTVCWLAGPITVMRHLFAFALHQCRTPKRCL